MNILYEDAALVVLDKPAGLSSEEGVPAALRQLWSQPDAFVGVVHRLDTGVSGLMVFARTPWSAAALSRQITQSQNAYAVQDAGPKGSRKCRSSSSDIGPSLQAGRTKHCPPKAPCGLAVQGQPPGPGIPGQPPPQGRAGSRAGIPHRENGRRDEPC